MQRNKGAGWSQEPLPLTGASYCRLAERGNLLLCEAAAPALALLQDRWHIVQEHRLRLAALGDSTEVRQVWKAGSTE